MNEQTEMELGQESQFCEQESQREQLLAETQEGNKQLEAENRKLREYICFDCEGREYDHCEDWLNECNERCSLERALKGM